MASTSQNPTLFNDYEGFVEKFKPKKTTDDCYTPPVVYDAVADWAANEYGLDRETFVRPFCPGGDFESFDYTGAVVVDNPPFSILGRIVKFYVDRGIGFFLFCPTLTCCRYGDEATVLPVGVDIVYENGAVVCTSFVTNLEPHEIRARTAPTLFQAVNEANKANVKAAKKQMPKYVYPPELLTTAAMYPYAKLGIEFVVPREESVRVSKLDSQAGAGKAVFGCGWLLSDRVTAEREKAEREKAEREKAEREKVEREKVERWPLSERERAICRYMTELAERKQT